MRNIQKLDPKKITDNGFYFDMEKGGLGILHLTEEEIIAARKHFHNRKIAKNVNVVPSTKLHRENKYQGRAKFEKNIRLAKNIAMTVAAVSITVYSGARLYQTLHTPVTPTIEVSVEAIPQPVIHEEIQVVEEEPVEQVSYEQEILRRYCNVYQVDYQMIYDKLDEMTSHFQSLEYLSGKIPGITCKGVEVQANSTEELLLYFVRYAKQLPENLGLNREQLMVESNYTSSFDYGKDIGYYSFLLGEDPGLIYSIVQAETSFASDLFVQQNNPAGLKMKDGSWWTFSTKEEGFIELILQVKAYKRKGATTIEEIGAIHAPASDNNETWLLNTLDTYQALQGRYEEIFGVANGKTL